MDLRSFEVQFLASRWASYFQPSVVDTNTVSSPWRCNQIHSCASVTVPDVSAMVPYYYFIRPKPDLGAAYKSGLPCTQTSS